MSKQAGHSSQISIAPITWLIFLSSIIFCLSALYISAWTTTGPSFLPLEENIKPSDRFLPYLLQVPSHGWDLALPSIAAFIFCLLLRLIPANNLTRLIVKSIWFVLAVRYFIWRTIATINFASIPSAVFSLLLYGVEAIGFFVLILVAIQSVWSTARQRMKQADLYEKQVRSGEYLPSVDVFVPTYNEPEFIVRRTVMGCQAMDYPNKTVYILDDTRRSHIRELAEKLGCQYITTQPGQQNKHAKAGNLNRALPLTKGDLVTIMDADFVPFKSFLSRTVGFFQQENVAMIQTPQDFYNPDHHVRNLGVDHILPNDLATFFSFGQTTRDTFNSVMCCGTSYVVRRKALEDVGGYYTRCVAEDSPTSTFMLTRGWKLLYLPEKLSMGESTRNYSDFLKQRLRWLQGNLQIFYCADEVPIWKSMSLAQKSFWLVQLIGCFNPLFRMIMLLAPLVSIYVGISPHTASVEESLYYFLPFMIFQACSFSWTVNYTVSFFWNEIYEIILCFPGLQRLFFTLRSPFGKPFVVTPKGVTTNSKRYNLINTWPLLMVAILTLIALVLHIVGYWMGTWQTLQAQGFGIVLFWLTYNLITVTVALLGAIDQPERRVMDRFPLKTRCRIISGDSSCWGYSENLSEGGAELVMSARSIPWNATVTLELPDYDFSIEAKLLRLTPDSQTLRVGVQFENLSIEQNRQLVEMLYTEVTWWKESKHPSSIDAMLAMLQAFFQFKPILNKFNP